MPTKLRQTVEVVTLYASLTLRTGPPFVLAPNRPSLIDAVFIIA